MTQRRTAGLLFALAALVRLPGLGRPPIGDEGTAVTVVRAPVSAVVDLLVHHDAHLPLYYLLLQLWSVVSDELWWLRLLSVAFGAGACVIVYRIGVETFGVWIGRAAFVVMAVSPLEVFLSQYLRPYALAVFLSTLAVFLATRLLRATSKPRFGRLLVALTVCGALLLYTYYLSLFIVLAIELFIAVYLLRHARERLPLWALSAAVLPLVWLPWLPYYAVQTAGVYSGLSSSTPLLKEAGIGFYVGPIQVGALAKAVLALLHADELRLTTMRLTAHWSPLALLLMAGVMGVGVLALTITGVRRLCREAPVAALLVVLTAAAPVAAACTLSIAGDLGFFHPVAVNLRYFGESAALFALVLGAALVAVRPAVLSRTAVAAFSLLLAAQLPFIYRYPFNQQTKILELLDRNPYAGLLVTTPSTVDFFLLLDSPSREQIQRRYERVMLNPKAIGGVLDRIARSDRFYFADMTSAERLVQFPTLTRDFEETVGQHGFVKTGEERVSDMLTMAFFERNGTLRPEP